MQSAEINFSRAQSSTRGFGRGGRGGSRGRGGRGGGRSDSNSGGNIIGAALRYHSVCGITHPPNKDKCLDKDVVCSNLSCKKTGHKGKNCTWLGESKYEEWKKKKEERDKQKNGDFFTSFTHIGFVHIGLIRIGMVNISVNEIYTFHICITMWILDSGVTHHCFGNRSLFPKTLKKVNDRASTASGEVLSVEGLGDITIPLSNGDFFTLTDVIYIPNLIVNLINIFKLHHRKWSISYPERKLACLYASSSKLVAHVDMNNNLFVFRTTNSKVNAAIGSTTEAIQSFKSTSSVAVKSAGESHIFVFSKFTSDFNI